MTDFSKYFTDPSAQVYGADETESALWQQSSTNPFAVLHAIAARRNANNRRDQYGEQLAAHDQRAMTGARTLMEDENKYNSIQEMLKQRMISPGLTADLSSLRTPDNSQQFDELSTLFTAGQQAEAIQKGGEGFKSFRAAGGDPTQMSSFTNKVGIGDLADILPTGVQEADARGRGNDDGTIKLTRRMIMEDGSLSTDTYEEVFKGPNRVPEYMKAKQQYDAEVAAAQAKKDARLRGGDGKGSGVLNAGGGGGSAPTPPPAAVRKPAAPITAPSDTPPARVSKNAPGYEPQPQAIPEGPVKADALMSAPPEQQKVLLTVRKQGVPTSRGSYVFEQNSIESDGQGNLYFRATLTTAEGAKDTAIFGITPEGKPFLAK